MTNSRDSLTSTISYGLTLEYYYRSSASYKTTIHLTANPTTFSPPKGFSLSNKSQYLFSGRFGGELEFNPLFRLGGFVGAESLPIFLLSSINQYSISSAYFPHGGIYFYWNLSEFIKIDLGLSWKGIYYLPTPTPSYQFTSNYGYRLGLSSLERKKDIPWSVGAELYYQEQYQSASSLSCNIQSFGLDWIFLLN
jgi:hypothetical protein